MEDAFAFAARAFRPLYYTRQYAEDAAKIEMSFDLTHYQAQFRGEGPAGPVARGDDEHAPRTAAARRAHEASGTAEGAEVRTGADAQGRAEPPLERHVFQTIFLDRDGSAGLWTLGEIAEERRVHEKWWKQQSHRWQHYAGTVPWMMFLNGKRHTQ